MAEAFPNNAKYTLPGLTAEQGNRIATILQDRLWALNDLQLVLKHAHWNVVGRNFIGVHEMLDPQVDEVRAAVDDIAERIAALGYSPDGRASSLVQGRTWDDYSVGRAGVLEHLGALDLVYSGVIESHRKAIDEVGELVFSGPGVMLGYAEHPDDLALGRMVVELRTGDLGRIRDDGLVSIVGRRDDQAKILGLRIDLARVTAALGPSVVSHTIAFGELTLVVQASDIVYALTYLRDDPATTRRLRGTAAS